MWCELNDGVQPPIVFSEESPSVVSLLPTHSEYASRLSSHSHQLRWSRHSLHLSLENLHNPISNYKLLIVLRESQSETSLEIITFWTCKGDVIFHSIIISPSRNG